MHESHAVARIVLIPPDSLEERIADLQATFEAMYGISAGAGRVFGPTLTEHATRSGFRLCAAMADGGAILGFGYGFTGGPGQPWRDDMARAVGPDVAADWLDGHFEFAEFGVVPPARRRGIGTLVYERVFAGLPHSRAVLTVRPGNTPARTFYNRMGWQTIAEDFVSPDHGPYLILGKRLSPP